MSSTTLLSMLRRIYPANISIAFARFYTTNPTADQRFYGGTLGSTQKF